MPTTPTARAARLVPLLVLVLAAAAAIIWGAPEMLRLEQVQDHRAAILDYRDAHPFLSLGAFLAVYIVIAATVPPGGFLMMLVAGFLFGFWAGMALAVVGCTLGGLITFYAARLTPLGRRLEDRVGHVRRRIQGNAFSAMLFLHIFPLVPYFLVNLAAGLTGVHVRKFALATALGVAPNAFCWVALGDGAGLALDRGEGVDTSLLANPQIYVPLGVLSALSGAVFVMRWRRSKTAQPGGAA